MIQLSSKQLQEQAKQLQCKKDTANEAFLDALTYLKSFEEVKKLFYDLKAIEAELTIVNTAIQQKQLASTK